MYVLQVKAIYFYTLCAFRLVSDLEDDHVEAVAEVVVCDAWTEQLARSFSKLATGVIEVSQVCFPCLRFAPLPEIGREGLHPPPVR